MINGELIYLACPYSEGDSTEELMHERMLQATKVAGQLIKIGYVVFSPLTHNEPINQVVSLPRTWDFWCQFDSAFLLKCTKLMVLTIDGWKTSIGVQAEIRLAKVHNIPIEYINIDAYEYVYITKLRKDLCHI